MQRLLFGAFGVPFGLALIIICGADLFTANICFMTAAFFEVRTGPVSWPFGCLPRSPLLGGAPASCLLDLGRSEIRPFLAGHMAFQAASNASQEEAASGYAVYVC